MDIFKLEARAQQFNDYSESREVIDALATWGIPHTYMCKHTLHEDVTHVGGGGDILKPPM